MSSPGYTPLGLGPRAREAVRRRGLRPVAGDFARWGSELVVGLPWARAGAHGTFQLAGHSYPYLHHPYKMTWLTERAVEVPVAQEVVRAAGSRRTLEVGNVLSHYGPVSHQVVDKYEQAPGILNRDVLDLEDLGTFELILAVSTLEHVGRDEEPQDPDAAPRALHALRARLAPGGTLFVTVPVGYNLAFDAYLRSGQVPFQRLRALRRVAPGPRWREVPVEEAWEAPYDYLLYSARAVVFAEIGSDG